MTRREMGSSGFLGRSLSEQTGLLLPADIRAHFLSQARFGTAQKKRFGLTLFKIRSATATSDIDDQLLLEVAHAIKDTMGPWEAQIAYMGGSEFAILSAALEPDEVARRLVLAILNLSISDPSSDSGLVQVNAGGVLAPAGLGFSVADLAALVGQATDNLLAAAGQGPNHTLTTEGAESQVSVFS